MLAGIRVPVEERLRSKCNLDEVGYPYPDKTDNPAYQHVLSSNVVDSNDQLPRIFL